MTKKLSGYDAARMLATQAEPQADTDNHILIVKGQAIDWISTDNFGEVISRLLVIQTTDSKLISGSMLGRLAQRMLRSEEKVGGPYFDPEVDKFELNYLIAQLFREFGTPLKAVESYLLEHPTKWSGKLPSRRAPQPKRRSNNLKIVDPISKSVLREIKSLEQNVSISAERLWRAIVAFDHRHEITKLTRYFVDSLSNKLDVPSSVMTLLGEANFFAWMSYYIYDDVIDGEDKTNLIPIANILQRITITKYQIVTDRIFVNSYFDEVDQANFYELNNYRFNTCDGYIEIDKIPDFNNSDFIASTAIGHILGPMIILEKYSLANDSQKHLISQAFRHYLIARKLNDDAHDWIEDLKNGHASLVLCFLFQKVSLKTGRYKIDSLTKDLKQYFWKSGLQEVTNLTAAHIKQSREYFLESKLFLCNNVFFEEILDPIENSAKEGADILKKQKDFLSVFGARRGI